MLTSNWFQRIMIFMGRATDPTLIGSQSLKKEIVMAAKTPAVNYTPELTEKIKAMYAEGSTVADIAAFAGKTTRSIVAKLSREGVYKAKEYVSKTGEKPIAKEAFVAEIAAKLGVDAEKLGGLEKANKLTLKLIFDALPERSAD